MPTTNSCDCPPPGGRIECHPDHAAVCYVNERNEVVGKCIPLDNLISIASLRTPSKKRVQLLVSEMLSKTYQIPKPVLLDASWNIQDLPDGPLFSIHLSAGSIINIKFPLSAANAVRAIGRPLRGL